MRGMNDIENPHTLSRRTTPTWEVELLISGIAVFAMLQLPGWLDDQFFALRPRFDSDWRTVLQLVYIYAKSSALILALTFVLHLLLRARWIALVGMHSVYPDGIRWDKLRIGPIARAMEQAREIPFPDIIENADNRATILFAVGVTQAMFVVVISIAAISMLGLSMIMAALSGGRLDPGSILIVLMGLWVVPSAVAAMIDQKYGSALAPNGRWYRLLQRMFGLYARLGFRRSNNPVMALLGSHSSDRKVLMATMLLMLLALGVAIFSGAMQREPSLLGNYALFPAGRDVQAIDSAHYDDQRNPARDDAVPYVQSTIIKDDYAQLVIPFQPNRDNSAMQHRCPQIQTQSAQARLECLSALHAIRLDGKPLPALRYEISSDPRTHRPALLAMIDVRTLADGRHELHVARPPRSDSSAKDTSKDPGFDVIAFWR